MNTVKKTVLCGPLFLAILGLGTLAATSAAAAVSPAYSGSENYDDTHSNAERQSRSALNPVALEGLMTLAGGNAFGFGLGARLSYTLDSGVFFGGAFTHYLGSSIEIYGVETSHSSDKAMIEGGYEFWWKKIGLRPYAGIGMLFYRSSTTYNTAYTGLGAANNVEFSDNSMAAALGAQFTYAVSEAFYVGADGQFLNTFDDVTDASFQLAGRIGTSF